MQDLIDHLYALADGSVKPKEANQGLCRETDSLFPDHVRTVTRLFRYWSKYTGNIFYPVPHNSMCHYSAFETLDKLWTDDQYGDNRRDLCRFCAQQLEKRLKGESDENKS